MDAALKPTAMLSPWGSTHVVRGEDVADFTRRGYRALDARPEKVKGPIEPEAGPALTPVDAAPSSAIKGESLPRAMKRR